MDILTKCTNFINTFSEEVLRTVWRPRIYDVAFPKENGSYFFRRIPRTSDGVTGLTAKIAFLTQLPWAWRGMTEGGYTPSGGQFDSNYMTVNLGCHAASAMLTLFALEGTQGDANKLGDLVNFQLEAIARTFPYYLRSLVWTSSASKKAVGKVASYSAGVATLDNAGLWNDILADRCKLFVPGMIVQAYRGDAKEGAPVLVTDVDEDAGTVTLGALTAAVPTLVDNDVLVPCDVGGLDVPYAQNFPGIFDVIDDDNTFQGVDRSAATARWARAGVESLSGLEFSRERLTAFFRRAGNPREAFTHPDILDRYFAHNLASARRFSDTRDFVDGFDSIKIGMTQLIGDEDCDHDKIVVPDFTDTGMKIYDHGAIEALFGREQWQQVPGRPFIEHSEVWWGTLAAEDCRGMRVLNDIDLSTDPVSLEVRTYVGS